MRSWEVAVEQSRDLCCLSETDMFVVSPDNKQNTSLPEPLAACENLKATVGHLHKNAFL